MFSYLKVPLAYENDKLNYFVTGWTDPLYQFLFAGRTSLLSAYFALVLLVGTLSLVSQLANKPGRKWIIGAAVALPLLLFTQLDPFILKIAWFPALLAALLYLSAESSALKAALLANVVVLWIISASALAPLGLLLAAIWIFQVSTKPPLHFPRSGILIVSMGLVFSIWMLPNSEFPQYPPGARLAPLSPFVTTPISSMTGPMRQSNSIIFPAYQQDLRKASCLYLGLSAGILLLPILVRFLRRSCLWRELRGTLFSPALLLLVGWCLLFGELALPDNMWAYSPFQSLRRVVPGLGLTPIPWELAPLMLTFGLLTCIPAWEMARAELAVLALSVLALLLGHCSTERFVVRRENSQAGLLDRIDHSPSRYLVRHKGSWSADPTNLTVRSLDGLKKIALGTDLQYTAVANPNDAEKSLALDGNLETRWSSRGAQRKGDSFELDFDRPVRLLRIFLRLGAFKSDFPGGLAVDISKDGQSYERVVEEPHWLGPVDWTADGYPFFGPQQRVLIDLPQATAVRGLRLSQIAEGLPYDWSIAEIELYGPAVE